jgi:sugar lactone lactonase YvrE
VEAVGNWEATTFASDIDVDGFSLPGSFEPTFAGENSYMLCEHVGHKECSGIPRFVGSHDETAYVIRRDRGRSAIARIPLIMKISPSRKGDRQAFKARPDALSTVASPTEHPGGLALSPDHALLALTDSRDRHQWSMQLQADGTPGNAEPFYRLEVLDEETGASGAAFDSIGQVYFATALGVQVCEANGRTAMILNSPVADKPVESVAFGGPDHDWLYVTADGKLFRRKMKVHAVPVDKPEKPPQPPL